jgi:hyperosmotically inducible periplasmic protein
MRTNRTALPLAAALLTVGALLTLGACSSTQPAGQQVDDATITARVKAKLVADPEVNPFNIDVDTDAGVVTLRGTVEDPEAKAEAGKLARGTSGVRSVRNDIRVGDTSAEQRVDDGALVAEIKGRIAADPDLNPFNIDVDVNQGVVTLSGTVTTNGARARAVEIAQRVDGVVRVENQLKVGGGS